MVAPEPAAVVAPPADVDPLAFLQQAPQRRREIEERKAREAAAARAEAEARALAVAQARAAAEAEARAAAEAAKPVDPFANPLSAPPRRAPQASPLAAPPPDFSDMPMLASEATMAALAPVRRKQTLTMAIIGAVVLVIAAPLGYLVGGIGRDRHLVNKRVEDAERVLQLVKKSVGRIKGVLPKVKRLDPAQPDFETSTKFKTFNSLLPAEEVAGDNLLLGRLITGDLMRFVALSNRLHYALREHGRLTATKHRAYLEQIMEANASVQGEGKPVYVFFRPNAKPGGPPPKGHLVTVAGPEKRTDKEVLVPVRPLQAQRIQEVDINLLVGLDRRELMESAGPNVLALHADRVEALKKLVGEIDKMMDSLVRALEAEASKPQVIAF